MASTKAVTENSMKVLSKEVWARLREQNTRLAETPRDQQLWGIIVISKPKPQEWEIVF